jgi:DNA-binding IclR family transcriptional regulator
MDQSVRTTMSTGTHSTDDDVPRSVLGRAFSLLSAFTAEDVELSLGELSERTGLPKTTVHRLTGELIGFGALERGRYGVRLGLRLFTLGEQVPRHRRLRDLAMPYLEDLYEATHESAHLALLDGTEVVYLAKVCGHRSAPTASAVGGRLPAHCTAVGKALLGFSPTSVFAERVKAGLPRRTPLTLATPGALERDLMATAARGFSVDREETRMGIVSVAAPIFGAGGQPVAAIAIAGRTHTIRIDQLAPVVQAAARGLSQGMVGSRT